MTHDDAAKALLLAMAVLVATNLAGGALDLKPEGFIVFMSFGMFIPITALLFAILRHVKGKSDQKKQ